MRVPKILPPSAVSGCWEREEPSARNSQASVQQRQSEAAAVRWSSSSSSRPHRAQRLAQTHSRARTARARGHASAPAPAAPTRPAVSFSPVLAVNSSNTPSHKQSKRKGEPWRTNRRRLGDRSAADQHPAPIRLPLSTTRQPLLRAVVRMSRLAPRT